MRVNVIDNVAIVDSRFSWAGKVGDKPPFVDSISVLVDTWMKRKIRMASSRQTANR